MGTWVAGGRLAGTLTLMAGVWLTGTRCCMNWAACCFCCCSRRSCSCICSRMSCCRSRIREVMLEELKGGLEAPGCSELLWEDQKKDSSASTSRIAAPALTACRIYTGTWGGMGEDTLHHTRGNAEPTYFRYLAATLGCLNLTAAIHFQTPISSGKELFAVSIFTATTHEKK